MDVRLASYLDKYSSLFTADRIRDWLIKYCAENFDLIIEKKDIVIKNNKIVVHAHNALKNELLLRSKDIIEGLKIDFGDKAPNKIN